MREAAYWGWRSGHPNLPEEPYAKEQSTVVLLRQPEEIVDPFTEIPRSGARCLIAQAVEAEFETFLSEHAEFRLLDGLIPKFTCRSPAFRGIGPNVTLG